MYGILEETARRGMSFDELLTIPEQDEWVYSDGKSTTCVAFILAMYKAAGVFGPLADHIQVTEFTVSFSLSIVFYSLFSPCYITLERCFVWFIADPRCLHSEAI